MEKINEYEIDGLIQTLKETGIKGIMKYTDVLVLNHMCERGWIPYDRDGIIKTLKERTEMGYSEITNLLQRYEEWKRYLPSYSLGLNQKLDTTNKKYNTVIPFRWIGKETENKLIGFVLEGKNIIVYDETKIQLMKICDINKSDWNINWNESVKLPVLHQRYILDEIKQLKNISWL